MHKYNTTVLLLHAHARARARTRTTFPSPDIGRPTFALSMRLGRCDLTRSQLDLLDALSLQSYKLIAIAITYKDML